jgi:hypothetical protein
VTRALIVCPTKRPENHDRLISQWRQQSVAVPLVLVGSSGGPWTVRAQLAGALVLSGYHTIGDARNAGMALARELRFDWVIGWDDDDYHGPRRVEWTLAAIHDGLDALAGGIGFVRQEDGLFHYGGGADLCYGHSSAWRASGCEAPSFPPTSFGEDLAWTTAARRAGLRLGRLDPWGLVYSRRGEDHAYRAPRLGFDLTHAPIRRIGEEPDAWVDEPGPPGCLAGYPSVPTPSPAAVFAQLGQG